ncbi:MAG: hypothetical protein ABI760_08295 [Ferruginibacter sp.]
MQRNGYGAITANRVLAREDNRVETIMGIMQWLNKGFPEATPTWKRLFMTTKFHLLEEVAKDNF